MINESLWGFGRLAGQQKSFEDFGKLRILHNCFNITEAKRLMLKMISGLIYNENNGSVYMMYLWYVLQFLEAHMDFDKQSWKPVFRKKWQIFSWFLTVDQIEMIVVWRCHLLDLMGMFFLQSFPFLYVTTNWLICRLNNNVILSLTAIVLWHILTKAACSFHVSGK